MGETLQVCSSMMHAAGMSQPLEVNGEIALSDQDISAAKLGQEAGVIRSAASINQVLVCHAALYANRKKNGASPTLIRNTTTGTVLQVEDSALAAWWVAVTTVEQRNWNTGFMSHEALSPKYGSFHAGAYLLVLRSAVETNNTAVAEAARAWLKTFWALNALVAIGPNEFSLKSSAVLDNQIISDGQASSVTGQGVIVAAAGPRMGSKCEITGLGSCHSPGDPISGPIYIREYPASFLVALATNIQPRTLVRRNVSGPTGIAFFGGLVAALDAADILVLDDGTADSRAKISPQNAPDSYRFDGFDLSRWGLSAQDVVALRHVISARSAGSVNAALLDHVIGMVTFPARKRDSGSNCAPYRISRTVTGISSWFGGDDSSSAATGTCSQTQGHVAFAATYNFATRELVYLAPILTTNAVPPPTTLSYRSGNQLCAGPTPDPGASVCVPYLSGQDLYQLVWDQDGLRRVGAAPPDDPPGNPPACSDPTRPAWSSTIEVIQMPDPPALGCGDSATVKLKLTNSGTQTWDALTPLLLARVTDATHNGSDDIEPVDPLAGVNTISLDVSAPLACGDSTVLDIPIHRDDEPDPVLAYDAFWRLMYEADDRLVAFGETASYSIGNDCRPSADCAGGITPTRPYDAVVSAVSMDSELQCGVRSFGQVTVQNTGSESWLHSNVTPVRLGAFSNPLFSDRFEVPPGVEIACGEFYTFDVSPLIGSPPAGNYSIRWSMLREGSTGFFGTPRSQSVTLSCGGGQGGLVPTPADCLGGPRAINDDLVIQAGQSKVIDVTANDFSESGVDFDVVLQGQSTCSGLGSVTALGGGLFEFAAGSTPGQCSFQYGLQSPPHPVSVGTVSVVVGGAPARSLALVATYLPVGGSSRVDAVVVDDSPVDIELFYDESLGSFEHRPGGDCSPVQDNPGFLELAVDATGDSPTSCTLHKVLDGVTGAAVDCTALVNQPPRVVNINALKRQNTNGCGIPSGALQTHFSPDVEGAYWIDASYADGTSERRQVNVLKRSPQLPYPDVHRAATATQAQQAEHYDYGGEQVAYLEFDNVRNANPRAGGHGEQVDLAESGPGVVVVQTTRGGEWLEYTREVQAAGEYVFSLRALNDNPLDVANPPGVRLFVDGVVAGTVAINSREWSEYEIPTSVPTSGTKVFRIAITNGNVKLDQWQLAPEANHLSINPQPAPSSQTRVIGDDVVYTAGAAHDQGLPVSFQWQKNGVDLPGQTAPTLSLASLSFGDAGSYRVSVRGGDDQLYSNTVELIVVAAPLTVSGQPEDAVVASGRTAQFDVSATGGQLPYQYQWFVHGTPQEPGQPIAGATSASLTIANVDEGDEGFYSVRVRSLDNQEVHSQLAELTVLSQVDAIDDVYVIDASGLITGSHVNIDAPVYLLPNDLPTGEVELFDGGRWENFVAGTDLFTTRVQFNDYKIRHRLAHDMHDTATIAVLNRQPLASNDVAVACNAAGAPIRPLVIPAASLLHNDAPAGFLKIRSVVGQRFSLNATSGNVVFDTPADFCVDPNNTASATYQNTLAVNWNPAPLSASAEIRVVSRIPIVAHDVLYRTTSTDTITIDGASVLDAVSNPDGLTLKFVSAHAQFGGTAIILNGNSGILFHADSAFASRGYDIVDFTVADDQDRFLSSAKIRVVLAPVPQDDMFVVATPSIGLLSETPISVPTSYLTENDSSPLGRVVVLGVDGGARGQAVVVDGAIQYKPSRRFWEVGYDQIRYTAWMDTGVPDAVAEATLTIVADYALRSGDDAYVYPFGSKPTADLVLNDSPPGFVKATIQNGQATDFGGEITVLGGGVAWGYTPPGGHTGHDRFTYRASVHDNRVAMGEGVVWLFRNSVPVLQAISDQLLVPNGLNEVSFTKADLKANDVAQNLSAANIRIVQPPIYGEISYSSLVGRYTYSHAQTLIRSDRFTYQLVDSLGRASAPATVTLLFQDADAVSDVLTLGREDRSLTIEPGDLLANDFPAGQLELVADAHELTTGRVTVVRPPNTSTFKLSFEPYPAFWIRGWERFPYTALLAGSSTTVSANVSVVSVPEGLGELLQDSFDDGSLSRWQAVADAGAVLSASADRAIAGEHALEVGLSGAQKAYLSRALPAPNAALSAQFFIDPEALVAPDGSVLSVAELAGAAGPSLRVRLRRAGASYEIRLVAWDDAGANPITTAWAPLAAGPTLVKLTFVAASAGSATMSAGTTAQHIIPSISNASRSVTSVAIGAVNAAPAGTSGVLVVDDFRSWVGTEH